MRWARAAYGKLAADVVEAKPNPNPNPNGVRPRLELRQAYWNYYYAVLLKTARTCTPAHELRARYEEGVLPLLLPLPLPLPLALAQALVSPHPSPNTEPNS